VTSSLEAIGREGIVEYINRINEDIFKNEGFV
jgi:GTP-binding protein